MVDTRRTVQYTRKVLEHNINTQLYFQKQSGLCKKKKKKKDVELQIVKEKHFAAHAESTKSTL